MKKKWLTKITSVCLAFSMMLGLCACGGNSAEDEAKAAAAKEAVYSYKELELPYEPNDNEGMSINGGAYFDGRLYYVATINSWDESGGKTELRLWSMLEDGSDTKEVLLQLPEEKPREEATVDGEATEENADSNSSTEIQPRAEVATADIAVTLPALPEDGGVAEEGTVEEVVNTYTYTNYSHIEISNDGQIYAMKNTTFEDYSDPNNYIWEQSTSVVSWDLEGNLLWEQTSDVLPNQENGAWIQAMDVLPDGGVIILMSGEQFTRVSVDKDGNIISEAPLDIDETIMQNMTHVVVGKDNSLIIMSYNNEWTKMTAYKYDLNTDTMDEGTELPSALVSWSYNEMMAGMNTDLMYYTDNGIYTYNVGDAEPMLMMSFINSDMAVANVHTIVPIDETCFAAIYRDVVEYNDIPAIFTKVNPEDIPDKKVLTLAGVYVGTDVKNRVIDFNKASDIYRIVVKEYSSYNTMEDYQAGYTQLNNDIITGNMPDILVADAYDIPVENYIAKGLLADVGKLIESDEELSQLQYLENVFDAHSVDGVLYYVVPTFYVQTYIAKDKWVGDRTTWTIKDMIEVVESMPEGATALGAEWIRNSFVSNMLLYCGQDFVDPASGKCAFDSEEFIALLEYAKTLPAELSEDFYSDDSFWQQYESQYREDRTLLYNMYMSDFSNLNYSINGYIGDEVAYIGFPSSGDTHSIMGSDTGFVISSKSKNIEGAWQFLREYLTEEYQKELEWGLPVLESAFLEKSQAATKKPTYTDYYTGEEVEYDDYFYMNGEEFILEPLNQEQLDQVIEFIKSVDKRTFYNENITNIITEEAEAFFSDQKSAAEVAQIIQSRAQIYVDENRQAI